MTREGALVERIGLTKGSKTYLMARRAYRRLRPQRTVSYSEFAEDMILRHLLPESAGVYVDVGASDPIVGSNTYGLYLRGWSGVLIEPIERHVEAARVIRARDRVIRALCGESVGARTFYEYDSSVISTMDDERVRLLSEEGLEPVAVTEIPVIRLDSLGLEAIPTSPSLLCVDAEGADLDVLRGNDWGAFHPGVVCVEEPVDVLSGPTDVRGFLEGLGYSLRAYSLMSSVYVHEDWIRR